MTTSTYRVALTPDAVAEIVATAMCPKCALRRRHERLRRIAAQAAARQKEGRPAWDTRCVRGCGAVVLEPAQSCGPCTETAMRAHWAADAAAVRREWAWVAEKEQTR